jgi:hypothetical protein
VGINEKRLILDVRMESRQWQKDHYNKLSCYYRKAPFFDKYETFLKETYLEREWEYLYKFNRYLIKRISRDFLGIQTEFADSRDFESHGAKNEKLISLLVSAGAGQYVSGPAAKAYIFEPDYEKAGIELIWKDYSGYPIYKPSQEPLSHHLSVLDVLFNTGDDAPYYIWGWRKEQSK